MGIFGRLFGQTAHCPLCGAPGGRSTLGGFQCVDPQCRNFDMAGEWRALRQALEDAPAGRGSFHRTMQVDYQNFRDERRTFTADRDSVRIRGIHLSVRVQPSGRRIALQRDRIRNLGGLIATLRDLARERGAGSGA